MLNVLLTRRSLLLTALAGGAGGILSAPARLSQGRSVRLVDRLEEVGVSLRRLRLSSSGDGPLLPSRWFLASGAELPRTPTPLAERPAQELDFREVQLKDVCGAAGMECVALAPVQAPLPPLPVPVPLYRFLHQRVPFLHPDDLDVHLVAQQRYAAPAAAPRVSWSQAGLHVTRHLELTLQFSLAYHFPPARLGVILPSPGPDARSVVRDVLRRISGADPGEALSFSWSGPVRLRSPLAPPDAGGLASQRRLILPYVLEGGAEPGTRSLPAALRYREAGTFLVEHPEA